MVGFVTSLCRRGIGCVRLVSDALVVITGEVVSFLGMSALLLGRPYRWRLRRFRSCCSGTATCWWPSLLRGS